MKHLSLDTTAESTPKWWNGVYLLAGVGFLLRIAFSLASDNIHHPDELFQYLEQPHRLVFGYGYIPWEFRFGARSWIIPFLVSAPLFLLKALHFDSPAIYIPAVKIFFSLISTSLIFSTYSIARNLSSETAGRLAAFFSCFWYELIFFAPRPLTDVISGYTLVAALACSLAREDSRKPILLGLLVGLSIAIRFHITPAAAVIAISVLPRWKKPELLRAGLAFLSVVLFAGFLDFITWGHFFVSYYNYSFHNSFFFNITKNPPKFFGHRAFIIHFVALTICSAGMFAIVGLLSLSRLRKLWLPFLCVFLTLLSHSILKFKNYRFVFCVIPLLLVMGSILLACFIENKIAPSKRPRFYSAALLIFLLISILGTINKLPLEKKFYNVAPLYTQTPALKAYRFLSEENNVAAVLEAFTPRKTSTGGYYYLHQDVPIYFPEDISIENDELTEYVSHVVCRSDMKNLPGFQTIATFGRVEIRKQTNPPHQYRKLDHYSRNILMPGIDDRYKPTVRPRL